MIICEGYPLSRQKPRRENRRGFCILLQKLNNLEITIYFCYKKAAVENPTAAQGVING
jgi:hypothetical protein